MASKYIDNDAYATSGYTLSGVFQSVTIGSVGYIGGRGLIGRTTEAYTIVNRGRITGTSAAVSLSDGGSVSNTGTIWATGSAGTGVTMAMTGMVTNGTGGLIEGDLGVGMVAGSVANAGTIIGNGTQAIGVELTTGTVANLGAALIKGNIDGIRITGVGNVVNSAGGVVNAGGFGIHLGTGTIDNAGSIEATAAIAIGISLDSSGLVDNQKTGLIEAYAGVGIAAGTVANAGTIIGTGGYKSPAVVASANAHVTNSVGGLLEGYEAIRLLRNGYVTNSGTILGMGPKSAGIYVIYSVTLSNLAGGVVNGNLCGIQVLDEGGTVTNAGLIEGTVGILSNIGDVILYNSGTIDGKYAGVETPIGSVTNATEGVIGGNVSLAVLADDVNNSGTIIANMQKGSRGVELGIEGALINNTGALIEGNTGVYFEHGSASPNAITNNGTIIGFALDGIRGPASYVDTTSTSFVLDAASLVEGKLAGIYIGGGYDGTIQNSGSIVGSGNSSSGAYISCSKGVLTNNAGGLIGGTGKGVLLYATTGVVTNAGTIRASGATGIGLELRTFDLSSHKYGTITNLQGGVITGGSEGAFVGMNELLSNAGTIRGNGGGSVGVKLFADDQAHNLAGGLMYGRGVGLYCTNGTAVNYAKAVIDGSIGVEGVAGGTIVNSGTIESSAGAKGTAVIFEDASETLVDESASVVIGTIVGDGGTLELAGTAGTLSGLGTSFTGFGLVDVGAHASWVSNGAESVGGTFSVEGTLSFSGTLSGTGTLALAGTEMLGTGSVLAISTVSLSAGTFGLDGNVTDLAGFAESGGSVALAGDSLTLNGSASFTGGTVSGTGFVGIHATSTLSSLVVAGGAVLQDFTSLTDVGSLVLGDASGGSGRLVIESGDSIDITANGGISIASGGAGSFVNLGLFEKTAGTGLSNIAMAVNNSGTIAVTAGTLGITGTVDGTGRATIGSAGTLGFAGAVVSTQTIAFAGASGGELVLDDPSGNGLSFAGTVAGFGGSDRLDLATFAFSGTPTIGWSQTSSSSGTLTVTDGTKVAKLTLFGQFSQSGFGKAKDAGTGTVISYIPPAQGVLATPHH